MSDIEIEIDGKPLLAKPNSMVIQVADEAGIYIPRFCYHKHLTVAANCRMCLVEVEKAPKALPACATPVAPGMKIFTRSPKALAAQKAVMEFLLINHPLDCPICDQGGECELQDLSMGYGSPESYYTEGKRSVKDQDIGPLVATDMTRCIQCTRCVRFGDEIAGLRELGGINRGEHLEISTYVSHALHSEVSGNIIDLCPVGALTSKPFRFRARAWELEQNPSVAPHDCVGANIYVHTRRGQVMRVVPHENPTINETWISDRDRFSYQGLYHEDRLSMPLCRIGENWQETSWSDALEIAANGLKHVLDVHGATQLGALASPNATTEEFYLLQKLMRALGSENIDYRLRQDDFRAAKTDDTYSNLFNEIENVEHIVLIGSNIQKEQPNLGLRLRKAAKKGAKITVINMMDYRFHFHVSDKKIIAPHLFLETLQKMPPFDPNSHILLGASALHHPDASRIKEIAASLSTRVTYLTEGANAQGALAANCVPGESGLNAKTMLEEKLKGYLLLNVEPDLDCANPVAAIHAIKDAEFVVAFSSFKNPVLLEYANVILPIAPFTETSGSFINVAGMKQHFRGVAKSFGESRPGWKVLRVLGNFLGLEGFDYASTDEIAYSCYSRDYSCHSREGGNPSEGSTYSCHSREGGNPSEASTYSCHSREGGNPLVIDSRLRGNDKEEYGNDKEKHDKEKHDTEKPVAPHLSRIGDIPIYSTDSLVRRGKALQATQRIIDGDLDAVRLHPNTAKQLNIHEADLVFIKQGDNRIGLSVVFDVRVPVSAAYIPGGISATCGLSELFGAIEIYK